MIMMSGRFIIIAVFETRVNFMGDRSTKSLSGKVNTYCFASRSLRMRRKADELAATGKKKTNLSGKPGIS